MRASVWIAAAASFVVGVAGGYALHSQHFPVDLHGKYDRIAAVMGTLSTDEQEAVLIQLHRDCEQQAKISEALRRLSDDFNRKQAAKGR